MKKTLKALLVLALCFVTAFATISCGESEAKKDDNSTVTTSEVTEEDKEEAVEQTEEETEEESAEELDLSTVVLSGHEEMPFEEAIGIYEDALLEMAAESYDEVQIESHWVEGWSGEGAPDESELSENEMAFTYVCDATITLGGEEETSTMEFCLVLDTEAEMFSLENIVFTDNGEYSYSYFGDTAVSELDSLFDEYVYAE